jgi:hypothetical protein
LSIASHGAKKTIYIVTHECHLVSLSNLTRDTANNNALAQLDLISHILCLRDCTTNFSPCGQVGEKAMIVDFRIETQSWGYAKADILDKFCEGECISLCWIDVSRSQNSQCYQVGDYEEVAVRMEVVGEYRTSRMGDG